MADEDDVEAGREDGDGAWHNTWGGSSFTDLFMSDGIGVWMGVRGTVRQLFALSCYGLWTAGTAPLDFAGRVELVAKIHLFYFHAAAPSDLC